MGRKARPAMAGLEELGFRLKDLRTKAGISQMELSRRIGFDPTHGYKYILRLEKGLSAQPDPAHHRRLPGSLRRDLAGRRRRAAVHRSDG